MQNNVAGDKKVSKEAILAAITSLQSRGSDVNPYSVASAANCTRSQIMRDGELLALVTNARGTKNDAAQANEAGGSEAQQQKLLDETLAEKQAMQQQLDRLSIINQSLQQTLQARHAESEDLRTELEQALYELEHLRGEYEKLATTVQMAWQQGYAVGQEAPEESQKAFIDNLAGAAQGTAGGDSDAEPVDHMPFVAEVPLKIDDPEILNDPFTAKLLSALHGDIEGAQTGIRSESISAFGCEDLEASEETRHVGRTAANPFSPQAVSPQSTPQAVSPQAVSQSMPQAVSQSTAQAVPQSTPRAVSQSTAQPVPQSMPQAVSQSTAQPVPQSMPVLDPMASMPIEFPESHQTPASYDGPMGKSAASEIARDQSATMEHIAAHRTPIDQTETLQNVPGFRNAVDQSETVAHAPVFGHNGENSHDTLPNIPGFTPEQMAAAQAAARQGEITQNFTAEDLHTLFRNRYVREDEPDSKDSAPAAPNAAETGRSTKKFVGTNRSTAEAAPAVPRTHPPEIRKACRLLGLNLEEMTLTRATVFEAWKKEMAKPGVHPDTGGDTEMAIYLNTAKDTLIRYVDDLAPKLGKKLGGQQTKEQPKSQQHKQE